MFNCVRVSHAVSILAASLIVSIVSSKSCKQKPQVLSSPNYWHDDINTIVDVWAVIELSCRSIIFIKNSLHTLTQLSLGRVHLFEFCDIWDTDSQVQCCRSLWMWTLAYTKMLMTMRTELSFWTFFFSLTKNILYLYFLRAGVIFSLWQCCSQRNSLKVWLTELQRHIFSFLYPIW